MHQSSVRIHVDTTADDQNLKFSITVGQTFQNLQIFLSHQTYKYISSIHVIVPFINLMKADEENKLYFVQNMTLETMIVVSMKRCY